MKTELEEAKNWAKDKSYWEYLNLLRKYPQTNLAYIHMEKEHLVETIEDVAFKHTESLKFSHNSLETKTFAKLLDKSFIEGAKYQLSKEKTIIQLLKEMKPSDRVELISEYCNEDLLNTINVLKLTDTNSKYLEYALGESIKLIDNITNTPVETIESLNNVFGSLIENNIKEGVKELFQENFELSKIGSKEQYSQYLDTIFPDSKVTEIDNSLYTSVINQLVQENKLEKDCTGGSKLKAEDGIATLFEKGGK